jgi:hypothetical protein
MTTAENSVLYYEAGQAFVPMTQLTDAGDHKVFNSEAECWSDEAGFSPVIKPDGVLTGLVVSAGAGNNQVNVSAGTMNLGGKVVSVDSGAGIVCVRGTGTDVCVVNSVTITAAGAFAVIAGTAGAQFSEVRGAEGGPPFIPAGSVEIARVRFSSITAAPVSASEILAVPNKHREMATYPAILTTDFIREQGGMIGSAGVTFSTALMRNHIGDTTKKVYAQYYEPEFAEIGKASDFQPAANSLTTSSQPYYGGAIGEVSTALKSGKFKAYLDNGIADAILAKEGKKIWFKYLVDRYRPENYILTQGYLGVAVQYPARGSIYGDFTINATEPGKRIMG